MIDFKLIASCLGITAIVLAWFAAIINAYQPAFQRRRKSKRQEGFSLVELIIVVSIILVIAAIAIPSLINSRQRANESSAINAVKTVLTSETTYNTQYNSFSPNLVTLGDTDVPGCAPSPTTACIVSGPLSNGQNGAYVLTLTSDGLTPSVNFIVTANPISGWAGQWSYCSDASNILFYDTAGACTPGTSNVLP